MLRFLAIFLIVSASNFLFAQSEELVTDFMNSPTNITALSNGGGFFIPNTFKEEKVGGHYYLNPNWQKGKLKTNKNDFFKINGRYRIYDDEMQIFLNNRIQALDRTQLSAISIGDQIFVPLPFITGKGKVENSYFELLVDGEIKMVLRRSTRIVEEYHKPGLSSGKKRSNFVIQSEPYYWLKGQPAVLISKNKNFVLDIFKKQKPLIEEFAKKNKIGFKKIKDLEALFQYYNDLPTSLNKS